MSRILSAAALGLCLLGAASAALPQSTVPVPPPPPRLYRVADVDVGPKVIKSVEPAFTEDAKTNRIAGDVLVYFIVDEQGNVQHARVVRGLGHGLDEASVAAARQYLFKPAIKDGKPVACELAIQVRFEIIDNR